LEYYDVTLDKKDKFEFALRPLGHILCSQTPPTYVFECESEKDLKEWISAVVPKVS
jgi:hypothetical protein